MQSSNKMIIISGLDEIANACKDVHKCEDCPFKTEKCFTSNECFVDWCAEVAEKIEKS